MAKKQSYATIRIEPGDGEPLSGCGTKIFAVLKNGEEIPIEGVRSLGLSIGVDSPPTAIIELVDWSMGPTKAAISLSSFDKNTKRRVKRYGTK